jgi:hypothetical protein
VTAEVRREKGASWRSNATSAAAPHSSSGGGGGGGGGGSKNNPLRHQMMGTQVLSWWLLVICCGGLASSRLSVYLDGKVGHDLLAPAQNGRELAGEVAVSSQWSYTHGH